MTRVPVATVPAPAVLVATATVATVTVATATVTTVSAPAVPVATRRRLNLSRAVRQSAIKVSGSLRSYRPPAHSGHLLMVAILHRPGADPARGKPKELVAMATRALGSLLESPHELVNAGKVVVHLGRDRDYPAQGSRSPCDLSRALHKSNDVEGA